MSARYDPPDCDDDTWDEDDPDAPQARDVSDEDDDETPTVPCPNCRRPVPDFVDRCPYCGDWIVQTAGAPARHNLWFIIAAIAALAVFVTWYVL